MPAGCARVLGFWHLGEGKVVCVSDWEGQPQRAAHAAQHLVGLNFVPRECGQRAKRGLNSCPEDNEARRKGFRERDWGG